MSSRFISALMATVFVFSSSSKTIAAAAAQPDFAGYYEKNFFNRDPAPPGGWPKDIVRDLIPGPIGGDRRPQFFGGTDESLPLLQPWAQARIQWARDAQAAGNNFDDMCRPRDLLHVIRGQNATSHFQILQWPDKIVFLYDSDSRFRIIYLNQQHPKNLRYSYLGHSVGHWEGSTLVVDTVGLKPNPGGGFYRAPTTEALHVVEHISLFNDGKAIQEVVDVDDPNAFVKPWRSVVTAAKVPSEPQLMEYECAENSFQISPGAATGAPRAAPGGPGGRGP